MRASLYVYLGISVFIYIGIFIQRLFKACIVTSPKTLKALSRGNSNLATMLALRGKETKSVQKGNILPNVELYIYIIYIIVSATNLPFT